MDKTQTAEGQPRKVKGENLVHFLAHQERVKADLEAGYPVKAAYNRYADTLDMSYNQFHRYVTRYLSEHVKHKVTKPTPTSKQETPKPPSTLESQPPAQESDSGPRLSKPTSGFKQFIPGPKTPNPKDLW